MCWKGGDVKGALAGRVAVITGASRGLGLAVAGEYVAAGASVVLCARDAVRLDAARIQVAGFCTENQQVLALPADVAVPGDAARLVAATRAAFPRLHILVNNAAVQGPVGRVWECDPAEWEHTFRVNLLSAVNLCRQYIPLMGAGGKIINISGGGSTGPRPGFSAYGTAKAALVRFGETLAEEVRALGIDVNCVAPGAISTAMTDAVIAAGPEKTGRREYELALRTKEEGEHLERAAALCTFLASSASDGITGRLLSAVWDPWETLGDHRSDLQQSDVYTLRRIVPADRGFDWGER